MLALERNLPITTCMSTTAGFGWSHCYRSGSSNNYRYCVVMKRPCSVLFGRFPNWLADGLRSPAGTRQFNQVSWKDNQGTDCARDSPPFNGRGHSNIEAGRNHPILPNNPFYPASCVKDKTLSSLPVRFLVSLDVLRTSRQTQTPICASCGRTRPLTSHLSIPIILFGPNST